MCQYTNVHARGKESEDFVMQKGTTSAQAPQKDSPFIPMAKAQRSSGSGSDKTGKITTDPTSDITLYEAYALVQCRRSQLIASTLHSSKIEISEHYLLGYTC